MDGEVPTTPLPFNNNDDFIDLNAPLPSLPSHVHSHSVSRSHPSPSPPLSSAHSPPRPSPPSLLPRPLKKLTQSSHFNTNSHSDNELNTILVATTTTTTTSEFNILENVNEENEITETNSYENEHDSPSTDLLPLIHIGISSPISSSNSTNNLPVSHALQATVNIKSQHEHSKK